MLSLARLLYMIKMMKKKAKTNVTVFKNFKNALLVFVEDVDEFLFCFFYMFSFSFEVLAS